MATLTRTLRLNDLILLIVGCVIGSGIFLVPGTALKQVHGAVWLVLLVWFVGGVLSLLGALTYGELSAANPKAGGLYVYIRDCFGPLPAFLFGWAMFFAISGGAIATLAVAFSNNLNEVIPMSPAVRTTVSLVMIAVVTAVNVRGTRHSANLQNWTTAIKVGAILVMSVALLALGSGFSGAEASAPAAAAEGSLASGFGLAMIGVLWAYEGWQYGTFSAGETINAQRNYPRAYLVGMAALIGIYLLANVAYLAALGPEALMRSESAAASSLAAVVSPGVGRLIAIAIALSIFSAANAVTLTSPRVYYAMAQDKLFFQKLAEVHPRFHTPAFAVVAASLWAAALAATGTFRDLLTYVVFTGWLFYALGAASIFIYRRREPARELPYKVPGYPWTPLLFILAAAALVVNTIVADPMTAAKGLGIVLTGAPIYFIWRARSRAVKGEAAVTVSE
ncbi:MAG TPA: amino acid permease [Blastocatellia bacterium]|nr:amino acid permease [Blastocatellia bacterium]